MDNQFFQRVMGDFFVSTSELNHMNILHGGILLTKVDTTAGTFANSFSHTRIVTGEIKDFLFYKKSHVGDHINFKITLLKTTKSTMTIYVEIDRVPIDGRESVKIGEGILIYVAVDENLKPTPILRKYNIKSDKQRKFIDSIIKKFNI
ncbi:MAG: acyl-CoA thioesterase [Lactobacillus crispatus]